jgi:hypothetical protein
MKILQIITLCTFILFSNSIPAQQLEKLPRPKVQFIIPSIYKIELPNENTLTGYLGVRYNDNLNKRLLEIDENGILEGFKHRPGKQVWIGEHVGKYLESAANTWVITKDANLKIQMDRIATSLMNAQLPDGYLGTYSPDKYWTSWDVWFINMIYTVCWLITG